MVSTRGPSEKGSELKWYIAGEEEMLAAFRDAGIKFAHKQVTVNVPESFTGDRAALAAEGAAALAAQDAKPAG